MLVSVNELAVAVLDEPVLEVEVSVPDEVVVIDDEVSDEDDVIVPLTVVSEVVVLVAVCEL